MQRSRRELRWAKWPGGDTERASSVRTRARLLCPAPWVSPAPSAVPGTQWAFHEA